MLPILSVEQMRRWERDTWASGQTEKRVIRLVGQRLAERILDYSKPGDDIWIVAGKGHNGDDGRAAVRGLTERNVTLLNVTDPKRGFVEFSEKLRGCGRNRPARIIDALFGIGLSRPLKGDWGKLIEALNNSEIPIAAVDVPSGLNADTGEAEGAAIRAEMTLTVGAPKVGLLKGPEFTGRVETLSDVGFVECAIDSALMWTMPEDFAGLPPRRPVASNKGDFGHVAIIAGSHGYHGAAVVSAWGALRARPGLVTVYPQKNAYVPVAAQLQSAMVHAWQVGKTPAKNCSTMLFGPGMAADDVPSSLKKEMRTAWRRSPLAMVVDASALDWLQAGATPAKAIRVITPHPGEAGRLLGSNAKEVQADRVGALQEISKKFGGCCVVLKGHQTLVGHSTGKIFVNSSGNPWLAQGGSGDLLSGYVAGLLAQPDWRRDALLTARFAVWQHGATADRLWRTSANWTIGELARRLGEESA
ncbi:MAG TPA: NAD(P)H-hydrate dehydratase [Verrucomicrobiae bacterium]|jgi:NAD(P)H-hydrate epimerase|nr:NAD(P)H-hydrate dehydratase [Verrucomicrobiae bacterium]